MRWPLSVLAALVCLAYGATPTGLAQTAPPLRLTSITATNRTNLILRWEGGLAPYRVQMRTNFTSAWVDFTPHIYASNCLTPMPVTGPGLAMFRVRTVPDSIAPSAPSGLTATAVSPQQINLSWMPSADNSGGSGVKGYNVLRNGTLLHQVMAPAISVPDSGLTPGTRYSYSVAAFDYYTNQSPRSASAVATTPTAAPAGAFVWAKNFGGPTTADAAMAYGVASDSAGNVFVTGSMAGAMDFGGGTIASAGSSDAFLAKYSQSGAHLWSKRFGGSGPDVGYGVATDRAGNVIVAGYFNGTADFGGDSLTSAGANEIFIARYSPAGAHLWSKRFGGTGSDMAYTVAVDAAGNIVVGGLFWATVDFGGGPLTSAGSYDVFVAKYSPTGVHLWSKSFGGAALEALGGVAVDPAGNVLVAGGFKNTADFGTGPIASAGDYDIFVTKFSPTGSNIWVRTFGGTDTDRACSIAADASGNVILAGNFRSTVNFGGGALTNADAADLFLAKLSSTGQHVWSKQFAGSAIYSELAKAVAVDPSGNVLVTGSCFSSLDLGGGPVVNAPGAGTYDVFVAKFTAGGAHVWSKCTGGLFDDAGNAITADANGNVIVAGEFFTQADFGGGLLTSPGGLNGFLVEFEP